MSDTKRKAEHLMAIKPCKDMRNLLNKAAAILGNPIFACDMEYKAIAYTENIVTDDPIWNEYETTGMVSHDRLIFYRDEGFFDMIAAAEKIALLHSDKLKYDRIFGKLFAEDDIQIGYICMVACYKSFEEGDAALFEMVCDILNKEFRKDIFYRDYGRSYMDTLINQLIDASLEDIDLYTAQIESVYIGLNSILHIAVADISRCASMFTKPTHFRDLFMSVYPEFKYVMRSKYVGMIMSFEREPFDIKEALGKLNKIFKKRNIYVGISGSFENLVNLPIHYTEAVNALNYGIACDNGQRIFLYDGVARDSQE